MVKFSRWVLRYEGLTYPLPPLKPLSYAEGAPVDAMRQISAKTHTSICRFGKVRSRDTTVKVPIPANDAPIHAM